MKQFKNLLFLGAGLLIGVVFGVVVYWSGPAAALPNRPSPPSTGKALQDFTLSTLEGKSVKLSDYRGKPVVLNFWATWCPPCREEMPLLNQSAAALGEKVTFLAVDNDEAPALVSEYIQKLKINIPVLLDPGGKINALYYVESYPITFFLDNEGILRAEHIGQLDQQTLTQGLEAAGLQP